MALRKFNTKINSEINTGFGTNPSNYGGRLVNKDGTANIRKVGLGLLERFSWFHSMLSISRWRFFLVILFFYVFVNMLFTSLYYLIGVEHLNGLHLVSKKEQFMEAFFFSTQTFTTVGYGRISPDGFLMNAVSSFQALIGLLSFAVATGLMYGRFSRPKSYIRFAEKMIVAPYKDTTALMLRLAPYKNTALSDAEIKVTLAILSEDGGVLSRNFYTLPLEIKSVNALTLSWTVVHPIDADSPLFGFTAEDFANTKGEIMIYLKAFDDMFSNTVMARTSFTFAEVVYGAKFKPMFHRDGEDNTTVIDLRKLNDFEKVEMPQVTL